MENYKGGLQWRITTEDYNGGMEDYNGGLQQRKITMEVYNGGLQWRGLGLGLHVISAQYAHSLPNYIYCVKAYA